jgi:hypothetical protein
MSNLSSALQQLRQEHKQAEQQVEKLQSAISVIEGLLIVGRNGSRASRNGVRPGRVTSVAARRRMALAQKARWAKARQESKPSAGKTNSSSPVKRTMSVAARRKIAAAQRARWAKFKAAKKAA